ncbi:MAG: cation transporter [Burkholderiales bacterium]|jgi:cobalt-zinc-cadmium efflux system protein|nr:cation transporter [Burkholderiales bacterium]
MPHDHHDHAPRPRPHGLARGHAPDHDHAAHEAHASARGALVLALSLTGGYALVEAIAGWFSGSLALLSDAGHMATDAASLGLALFAHAYASRPPSSRASFGHGRAEVLAAFVNAIAMLAIVVAIVVEAAHRLLAPQPVAGGTVLGVATVGLAVNVFVAWRLSHASGSVNARAALLHVMGDLLGSVAAIVAGAVILATGWTPIDPILSVVVALLILRSTWRLLRSTTGMLLERVPPNLDYAAIGRTLAAIPGVRDVHDLHVWSMGAGETSLSAHMGIAAGENWPAVLATAQRQLRERYGIHHVTLQPDWPRAPRAAGRRVIPVAASKR